MVLGKKLLYAGALCTLWQLVNRSVPFANRNDLIAGYVGEKFAKTPNSTLIKGTKRRAPLLPDTFQRSRIKARKALAFPPGIDNLEQIAAVLTAKSVGKRNSATTNTLQL